MEKETFKIFRNRGAGLWDAAPTCNAKQDSMNQDTMAGKMFYQIGDNVYLTLRQFVAGWALGTFTGALLNPIRSPGSDTGTFCIHKTSVDPTFPSAGLKWQH